MKNKPKPISRLTLVFILAVVVSGSILTWFSINNISNLKELTEKRIIEEQRELTGRFSAEIQNNLNEATSGFDNEIISAEQLREKLIETAGRYDFFPMPFILDSEGEFLFPNFSETQGSELKTKSSNRYNLAFQEGEKAEFTGQNLSLARSKYASCLRYSRSGIDSVKALNALGRVAVKLKRDEEAIGYYGTVAARYCNTSGPDGFPYVYYAIPQLLKNINDRERIKPMVEECLTKMSSGRIRLNLYTAELLNEVRHWADENTGSGPGNFQKINQLIESIDRQLQFAAKYKNDVVYAFAGGEQNHRLDAGNGFEAFTSFAANNSELLIVNRDFQYLFGFLVDGTKLFDKVLKTDLQEGFEFDYIVGLSGGYGKSSGTDRLVYASQASSFFPNQYLQIGLRNENLIDEMVKSRSRIYGIASVLLIVAMFLGVFLILRDIAREKHLARLRADFISNVTHELKTPLTSIYMFAESLLLRRVRSPEEKQEYLSIIIKESERLKRMINNILEFSKMEKGKSDYHFVEANLSETVRAAVRDLDYWLEKENFHVATKLDEHIETRFDPDKMKQALSNLISNAIKYSGDSRDIFIGLHRNSNGIVIDIEDKGIGMPEDQQEKIFEKFYRIDQKENISGTGLGLTVVKEIIEAHNGSITVSSKIGEGSKFSINLNQ